MKKMVKGCCGCLGALLGGVLILFLGIYVYSEWIYEEWPTSRIERITGIKVPEFKIIKVDEGERHFTGDYIDTLFIEFETVPSDELFDNIDQMIETTTTKWEKHDERYTFSTFWGNGYPAPDGESEAADGIFSITITKGEKRGKIISGAW
jgi:hypothetical protein